MGGQCYNCTYCCDDLLSNKRIMVPECAKAGMGRCTCPAYISCKDKKSNTCPTPGTSTNTKETRAVTVIKNSEEIAEVSKERSYSKFFLSFKKLTKVIKSM